MTENGGTTTDNNINNIKDTSFRMDEPPPDPEDFDTKEEEIKNKEFLAHLFEQQKKRRELQEELNIREKKQKELEEQKKMLDLYSKKEKFERRNASAKEKSKAINNRIKQLLDKVDKYMMTITNLDNINKIKAQAQKEFEEEISKETKYKKKISKQYIEKLSKLNEKNEILRNENKKKIEERKKNEILKKEKSKKDEKAYERAKQILQNGYKVYKVNQYNGNNLPKIRDENKETDREKIKSQGIGMFKEEEYNIGTNLSPNMIINNEINNNKNKRPSSSYKIGNNNNLNLKNKEIEINPEEKLKLILQKDPYNLKELLKFQKKYKYIDVGPYIHYAKMNLIKNNKNKNKTKRPLSSNKIKTNENLDNNNNNNDKIVFEEEEIGGGDNCANPGEEEIEMEEDDNNDKDKDNNVNSDNENRSKEKKKKKKKKKMKKKKKNINNYLEACKYNNDDSIKSFLSNAKDDEEVFKIVNERDEYGRNGLMYLLIHNNSNMIKLSILSGVVLDDSKDIYGRNLVHYCCTNIVDKNMLDIICHCLDFKRFGDLCNYVNKCILIVKRDETDIFSSDFQDECEKRIQDFDDLIKNKENKINVKEIKDNNLSEKRNITKIVNSPDIEGNYPIHYLAKDDNMDKMDILLYYHANLEALDSEGKKPINLTENKVIQQFLLKNVTNFKSKKNIIANGGGDGEQQLNNNSLEIKMSSIASLDINELKYYTPEKINAFYVGVENNNYLILSVIQRNYELFKFLITEKNAKVDYVNGNGWTILFFIVTKQLWNYFAFLFDLDPDKCVGPEDIYNELLHKKYEKINLMENNGDLTYLGQAFKILDNLSNKNENILSICIDEYNDIDILKSLLILYDNYIKYFAMDEPKNIVFQKQYGKYDESSYLNLFFNRQYGKNKETILIKFTKKKNLEILKFLLEELCRKEKKLNLDIYKGDCNKQNMLHHAVLLKQKEIIKYLIKYDSDNNLLKTNKDNKNKTPIDLDRTKTFYYEYITVWDAAEKNDVDLLKKLLKELKYYEVNEQTYINKNTPLHSAVKSKAERAVLYLLKEGADKNKRNVNGLTPLDTIEKVQFPDRKWIKYVKKILDGEIKEFNQLDKIEVDKFSGSNNSKINKKNEKVNKNLGEGLMQDMRLLELLSIIKEEIVKNKIDIKELFDKLDKNKNGKLSLGEFKKLFINLKIENVNENDITYIMSYFDINKDGKLQYQEFLSLMS